MGNINNYVTTISTGKIHRDITEYNNFSSFY